MKDLCVISCGPIQMTDVVGVFLLVVPGTHLARYLFPSIPIVFLFRLNIIV